MSTNLMEAFTTRLKATRPISTSSLSLSISTRLSTMKTLLLYLFLFFITAVHSQCLENQQTSLLHLKQSLTFDSSYSSKLISWNSSTDCCSWLGVTCTNGQVVGLDLSHESISGNIDNSSSLFDLQHLQSLDLSGNDFDDSQIPSAMGKLVNLKYLYLSHAEFSGQIPIEISRLTRLVILDLSRNHDYNSDNVVLVLNLSMLIQNLTRLEELYLDDVYISAQGTHWCQSISSSLPNLRVLSLSNCGLSGPIHQSLAKLHSLSELVLDNNYISAPFLGFFANFSNLTFLRLRSCGLYGSFPKEIFQIPTLQTIDLAWNDLEGSLPEFPKNGSLRSLNLLRTKFSGLLPESIGNLKMLSTIDVSRCNFSGSIPRSMANLTQLVSLDLSSNRFTGLLPESIGDLKMLSDIDVSSCKFTGSIPRSMANLTQLVSLDLSSNRFTGSVPLFSMAKNLVTLDLGNNLLNGSIPLSLFSLPSLKSLLLSHNQFSGQLPEFSNVSSSMLGDIDLSSNNLEGPVPISISNFQSLFSLSLSSNNFSVSLPLNGLRQQIELSFLDLSYNNLWINYNGINSSSFSFFPEIAVLRLASGNLRTFPDFLRNLSKLDELDLSENLIDGKIPNWIWRLNSLRLLNLSCNSLVSLEDPLLNISTSSLEMLDLHSNQLQGQIPIFPQGAIHLDYSSNNFNSSMNLADFGLTSLTYPLFISLRSTNLHGIIPTSVCTLDSLVVLDLSNNSLTGTIPPCLTAMPILGVLELRRNSLAGTISDNFPEDCFLQTLDLGENQLQGQFPESLANCTNLEVLNLGNNQITDTFPCLLKNISSLRVLSLRSNKFYGGIGCPETNGTWPILQIIDLAHNNFSGEIPGRALTSWRAMMANKDDAPSELKHLAFDPLTNGTIYRLYYQDAITVTNKGREMELVKILTVFTSMDFSWNKFNGSIPKEMGELTALYALNLSSNTLTGEIPSSFGNLYELESLDLSNNKLGGQIPREFAKLNFLSFLNLSNNQLVGRIPTSTQFSTFNKTSFEGNKGLWGPPLTADKRPGSSPPPSNGSHPDSGHGEIDWDVVSVEIGVIFGFGIAIASLVFCRRWRIWYYRAMYNMLLKIFPQLEERIGNHRRHVHINQRW